MFGRADRTPLFRDAGGNVVAGSVAEAGYHRLGGVDQWVLVRGRDRRNPLLVILHGGPGSSETAPLRAYNAELENAFVVVYWDQRGAGRSYRKSIDPASMTLAQFVADLDDLLSAMLPKFGQRNAVLLGHSWGSFIGVAYAAQRPDRVAAYVGVGQVSDMAASEAASYDFVLAAAERRGRRRALNQLRAIGPPPYGLKQISVQRHWLAALGGATGPGFSTMNLIWRALATPEASPSDLIRLLQGSRFSLTHMLSELWAANPARDHVRFEVPIIFVLGRYDWQVSAKLAASYFDAIDAPAKQLFWLERAGHLAPFEQPTEFNRIMIDAVRAHAVG